MKNKFELNPIPRSVTEKSNARFTNFKFDYQGEANLSKWMIENLSLSFYEHVAGKEKLKIIEKKVIKIYVPLLNIQNNKSNPFLKKVKQLRKECKLIAMQCQSAITSV